MKKFGKLKNVIYICNEFTTNINIKQEIMRKTNENINGYEVTIGGWPTTIKRKREVLETFTELKDSFPGASLHAIAQATARKREMSTGTVLNIAKEAGFKPWNSYLLK